MEWQKEDKPQSSELQLTERSFIKENSGVVYTS